MTMSGEEHSHMAMAGDALTSISVPLAFYGGLHNFFSVWIMCLLQVVPFIFATIVASSLIEIEDGALKEKSKETFAVLACCIIGFGIFYCALGSSITGFATFLFAYQSILLQIGGVILFLCSFYFLGILKVPESYRKLVSFGGSFLVGCTMGLAYQPCSTPTLSAIYNMIKGTTAFSDGLTFLIFYTLGLMTALAVTGYGLVFVASLEKLKGARSLITKGCGLLLLMISALILLKKMTVYKGFLVGM